MSLRNALPTSKPGFRSFWQRATSRNYSNGAGKTKSSSPTSRAERILSRLPPSMARYTRRLQNAPVSHVVAFLILHELTAILPLFGLVGLFHYTNYVPIDYMMGHYGGQVTDSIRRFDRYFRRKGWFGFSSDEAATDDGQTEALQNAADAAEGGAMLKQWESTDSKYKILVEVGLAYAITKVLLPVRIVASLWATPWFAGVLGRLRGLRRPPAGQ